MFVKDYMTRHPVMIEPTMSVVKAQGLMAEAKVRHLPVVGSGKRLAGLVTRERLRIPPSELGSLNVWEITRFLSEMTVKSVMVKGSDVMTVGPDTTLEEAAEIMVKNKIGCLVVLEEGVVVGIITEIDMLIELVNLLGGSVPGVRLTLRLPDRVGSFADITSAIAAQGWGIYGSGCLSTPKQPGHWDYVIRVRNVKEGELVAALQGIEDLEIINAQETG
jgi:acetoin utilization protein AcuB